MDAWFKISVALLCDVGLLVVVVVCVAELLDKIKRS